MTKNMASGLANRAVLSAAMGSIGNRVVEQLAADPEVDGSNPTKARGGRQSTKCCYLHS
jgi:hypothetical protein